MGHHSISKLTWRRPLQKTTPLLPSNKVRQSEEFGEIMGSIYQLFEARSIVVVIWKAGSPVVQRGTNNLASSSLALQRLCCSGQHRDNQKNILLLLNMNFTWACWKITSTRGRKIVKILVMSYLASKTGRILHYTEKTHLICAVSIWSHVTSSVHLEVILKKAPRISSGCPFESMAPHPIARTATSAETKSAALNQSPGILPLLQRHLLREVLSSGHRPPFP